jgi:hypothetical protein
MKNIIDLVSPYWYKKPPCDGADVAKVERHLGLQFPPDYIDLLKWSNGGEAKLGTAHFALWPIQDVIRRNGSASIFKYMTNRFVGIGTNGGDECYGLDYTGGDVPTLAIVPLGDLDPNSKYTIAATLTEGIQKALAGQFDDGEYNAQLGGVLSDELMSIRMTNIRMEADKAWQVKNYRRFVDLLDGVQDRLSGVEIKKLAFARTKL